MDGLSIASGAVGFVSLILQVATTAAQFIRDAKGFPDEFINLTFVTNDFAIQARRLGPSIGIVEQRYATGEKAETLKHCREVLEKILGLLKSFKKEPSIKDRIAWAFSKKKTVGELTQKLEQCKTTLALAFHNELLLQMSEENKKAFEEREAAAKERQAAQSEREAAMEGRIKSTQEREVDRQNETRKNILAWLSPGEFNARHSIIGESHAEGTGDWLLDELEPWLEGTGPRLVICQGAGGVGKTYLAYKVIQRLLNSSSMTVAFLYFDHQQAQSRRPSEYLSSLVHQLEHQKKSVCSSVQEAYDSLSPKSQKPDLGLLKRLLLDSVQSFGTKTYIVLDAFDECGEDGKKEFIETISKLIGGTEHIYLLITSRPHSSLDSVASLVPTATRTIPVIAGTSSQTKDLKRYLEEKLAKERLKDNERKFIRDGIAEKAKGLFLLATLHLKSVLAYRNAKDRKKALASLPKEINAAYEGEMARLKRNGDGDFEIAKRALSWIYWAKRPLAMRELQEAIAIVPIEDIETCDEESRDLDPESITDPEFILDCCGSLILWDDRADIVGFSHYTVSEFFAAQPDGNIESELYVAQCCLTYLCFDIFEYGRWHILEYFEPAPRYQLVRYIGVYVGSHVSRSQTPKVLEDLVLSVLWSAPRLQALIDLRHSYGPDNSPSPDLYRWEVTKFRHRGAYDEPPVFNEDLIFKGWEPLHFLSAWNRASTLDAIISRPRPEVIRRLNNISQKWSDVFSIRTSVKCDLNYLRLENNSDRYPTPLHVACFYDNSEVVALLSANCYNLLDLTFGRSGWTSLIIAATLGHERCVRLLVERGANLNPEGTDREALMGATWGNHVEVVGILLENGAGLEDRRDAMNLAGDLGHWKLVKLFLGTGEVANCRILIGAVEQGDEAMVQLLLEAGVDPLQDDFENPLHSAILRGYERIVRWLVEAGADMNAQSGYGMNALMVAKLHGREQIIQLLLEHGAH